MSSKKKVPQKKEFILFGAKHSANKSMGSKKKYEFQKKGTHTFFGPNIVPEKVRLQNKSSKKKGTHTYFFRATHCAEKSISAKKKYEFRKKKNSYFYRTGHCGSAQIAAFPVQRSNSIWRNRTKLNSIPLCCSLAECTMSYSKHCCTVVYRPCF